jgi:AcrR family transcriptional regulator
MEVSSRQDTKTELLRSAERLIAEKGFGSVSVKMITTDAGARNPSAVHYHFGSIESLIQEVFAKRFREIQQARAGRLEKVDESEPARRLVALVEAAIGPLIEACLEQSGRMYVSFCLQFTTDPRFDYLQLTAEAGAQGFARLEEELIACLPDVPLEKRVSRVRHCFMIALVQAADYAGKVEAGTAPPVEAAVSEAAACLAAYLGAPA